MIRNPKWWRQVQGQGGDTLGPVLLVEEIHSIKKRYFLSTTFMDREILQIRFLYFSIHLVSNDMYYNHELFENDKK